MIRPISAAILLMVLILVPITTSAYRDYFTAEQKEQLAKAQTVLVEVLALTDKGPVDAKAIADTVTRRLTEMGYTVVTKPTDPHDVVFKVKCEQHKTWEGTTTMGSDADLPDSPSRVWKGPACQLTYFVGSTKIKWQKEVRTDFEDAVAAAAKANQADAGEYAMAQLNQRLAEYDFPVLLAAEWGHADRLLKVLDSSGSQVRKLKVIALLGEMLSDEATPRLKQALQDKDLAAQAAVALGNVGKDSIPILIEMLRNSKQPDLQAAAAKGLGQVGSVHGDARIIPPLLEMLDAPGVDIGVQTEIAWALGKLPDKRSVEPLFALDRKLQKIRNDPPDPKIKKLKEAVFWAIKQVYTEDQYS
ncbi:MAG TPA: HEAT repeat domain-containing protein [Nitrospirales bacterium]|nr:HEAT repeat domain-containing protein [Nitrospirales bacterium]